MTKDDFQYFSQEFNSDILDLAKKKGFDPYEYMSDFEQFMSDVEKIDCHANKSFTFH